MADNPLAALFSLGGHLALVTGASSGLGVECAHALAMAGADLVVVARRGERLETLARELRESHGVRVLPIAADLTRGADLDRLMVEAAELGEIDILVNNAGIAPTGRAERLRREVWDETLAVNLTAPMMLAQRVAAGLIERRKPGRIINIASVLGAVGTGIYRLSAYTASKGALVNLTRQLAIEWAPHGINVNAIAPGWIPTEATAGGLARPGNREKMEALTPLGRLGRPDEIRGAVIFLASPAASYVTGALLAVDGGYLAW
ncbi:MAG TPA: glucose 1-dehydrogenase [Candidatus Binataceae bacterium]|nr:glucose 1-dehydrogenase [Candidatus Binataceae bacterium]